MKVKIRKATRDDLTAMLALIQELAVFEKQPDAVTITEKDLEEFGFGEVPLFYTYVAEIDREVVGMALYYYRFSTWKGRTIHLEDLVVKQKHRGKGVGEKLFQEVVKKASELKVGRMEWEALEWNTPALNFYKKAGTNFDEEWVLCKMTPEAITNYINQL